MIESIPDHTQILVIGGGPAGSYTAAALAREGFEVMLFETVKFPRYHIGESLLPSTRPFLRFIGAEEKIKAHGFCPKPGAAFKFTQDKREGYNDFIALNPENGAWNVVRSEFDELLLRHASCSGAAVFEEVKVTSILFEEADPSGRPIAAYYESKSSFSSTAKTQIGKIYFDYLVDATGRSGIMSQKYLKNRRSNKSLDNVAFWGYWSGCQKYSPGTSRENAVWVEGLLDETGWAWFIPLHDATVSVGVVQDQKSSAIKKRKFRGRTGDSTLQSFYLDELHHAPGVLRYIGDGGKLIKIGKDGGSSVKQAADFSYSAAAYAGPGYRLVGDASAFIDPCFSSGVHLAFAGGLSAAATISSSIRGEVNEEACAKWHDAKVGTAYTRFLLVVLGAYKQFRAHQVPVLSDINEDNFDRAFDLIRPIIQGTADVGKALTENELQKTMDFVKSLFAPTDPEIHAAVLARIDPSVFGPGFLPTGAELDKIVDPEDEEARQVFAKINARKAVYGMYDALKDFTTELIDGKRVQVEGGKLGLVAGPLRA